MKNLIIALLCLSFQLSAESKTIVVATVSGLKTAVAAASPGDSILLNDGTWNNAVLEIKGWGSAKHPIVIAPEHLGAVTFSGQSCLKIGGEYLVFSGFHFRNGYTPMQGVISFRINNDQLANHCRVTQLVIEEFSQPQRFKTDSWITLYGRHNRIDHSTFVNKLNAGPTIIAELDDERSQQNYHSIDSNYFKGRERFGSNGGESIRIGVSRYSLSSSRTRITHNYFERCNGEVEIVSIKSSENEISFNTFFECEGSLVLRHGFKNKVEGNLFNGNNRPFTGGVRLVNPGHLVINNVFYQLKGTGFRAALALVNGVPNSLINRYFQVTDARIENNTFAGCTSILFGAGKDAERTLSPQRILFRKNLITGAGRDVYNDSNGDGGIDFSGNVLESAFIGKIPRGFSHETLQEASFHDLMIATKKGYGAGLREMKLTAKAQTGARWYQEVYVTSARKPQVFKVSPAQANELAAIVGNALSGDTILLSESGYYLMKDEVLIDKPLVITTARGLLTKPVLVNGSYKELPAFFTIANKGRLSVSGIAFKGTYKSFANADAGIRSSENAMNRHYTLMADRCEFYDFNESTQSGFKASKSTLADTVSFTNSIFHHISGSGINLAAEKDDKGIYNAEYTLIKNCVFTNLLGSAVNIYRGGNDESTLGPFVEIDHCTFNEVDNREQGVVVRLIGAQHASVLNSIFANSGKGGRSVQFQEYRWDQILVDYCDFYAAGKVESFYHKALGTHVFDQEPAFYNPEKLNFSLKGNFPLSENHQQIGANNVTGLGNQVP